MHSSSNKKASRWRNNGHLYLPFRKLAALLIACIKQDVHMIVVPSKCSPFTIGPASYLFVSAYGLNKSKKEYIWLSPPENALRSFKIIRILVSVCKRRLVLGIASSPSYPQKLMQLNPSLLLLCD